MLEEQRDINPWHHLPPAPAPAAPQVSPQIPVPQLQPGPVARPISPAPVVAPVAPAPVVAPVVPQIPALVAPQPRPPMVPLVPPKPRPPIIPPKPRPPRPKAPASPRLVLRCTVEYRAWVMRLADHLGTTTTTAITAGLMHQADMTGFSRPPRRYLRKLDPDLDA